MFDTMKVAKKIKEARVAKNMTQQNLADAMEVSYQAVSNWERGNSMPDISKLGQLGSVLGISMEELLGESSEAKTVEKIILRGKNAADAEEKDETVVFVGNNVSLEELQEVISIMPPKEAKEILEENSEQLDDISFEMLREMAIFLDEEYLSDLVERYRGELSGCQLLELAPFLDEESVDKLMARCVLGDDVGEIAIGLLKQGEGRQLAGLYPFMSQDSLKRMAEILVKKGDFKNLREIAPFC